MKSAAAAITLDGDTSVRIEIKEQEHSITDDELQSLAAIWPGLRTEAAYAQYDQKQPPTAPPKKHTNCT